MVGAYAGSGRRRRTARHYDARAAQESHFVDGGRFDQSVFRAESRRQDDGPDVMKANRLARCVHERRWFGQFRDGHAVCRQLHAQLLAQVGPPGVAERDRSTQVVREPGAAGIHASQAAQHVHAQKSAGCGNADRDRRRHQSTCKLAVSRAAGLGRSARVWFMNAAQAILLKVSVSSPPRRPWRGGRRTGTRRDRPGAVPPLIDTLPALCRRSAPVLAVVVPVVVLGRIEH